MRVARTYGLRHPGVVCQHERPGRAQRKNSVGADEANIRIPKFTAAVGAGKTVAVINGDGMVGENEFSLGMGRVQ
jgi:hypothetical protein